MHDYPAAAHAAFRKTVTRLCVLTLTQLVSFQLFGAIMQSLMIITYGILNGGVDPGLLTDTERLTELVMDLYTRFPYSLYMIIPYVLSFVLVYGIYAGVRRLPVRATLRRGRLTPRAFAAAFFLVLGAGTVSDYVTRGMVELLRLIGLAPVDMPFMAHAGAANIFSVIVQVAVLPALIEEYAYRGVTLVELAPFGRRSAVVLSALLFSLMHAIAIQIPNAFLLGLLMAYLALRYESVWIAVFVHFANNGLAIAIEYLQKYNAGAQRLFGGGWHTEALNLVFLVFGIIGALMVRRPDNRPVEVGAPSGAKALFTSWGFYLLLAVVALFTAFSLERIV